MSCTFSALLPAMVLKMAYKGYQLPDCSISISWALSWNILHSSKPPHYNSLVNNHKSNGIHKPLRWRLLSLTLGSWDIHSRELCTSKPIICSIYAIFPSFIAWITLCVIIYWNISHHQRNMLYQIHSQRLYTPCRELAEPLRGASSPALTVRVNWASSLSKMTQAPCLCRDGAVPIFSSGAWKIDLVCFNSSESLHFQKGKQHFSSAEAPN